MAGIKCAVEECMYQDNTECNAPAIEVRSSRGRRAAASDDTCCETFKPRTLNRGGM
ncbi:MAG: DUF1540 domain-containing protein [Clostridia bacterium]|nr:MAG: DUF1540 domain-containing protein [Clostridia bacterium]